MTSHIQISVTVSPDKIELLSDVFAELGADAVTMTDAKDEPLFQLAPEDEPHWQHTTVHALFDSMLCAETIVNSVKENHPEFQSYDFYIEKIGDRNWVLETQKHFRAQQFGKLWVCPQWEKNSFVNRKNEPVIFIEPGLAFGTGTHPTTQLCLTWVANNIRATHSVVDYGCGSGILALGALAMGAPLVYATDHDEQALESTINNLQYNDFDPATLLVKKTNEMQGIKTDIVLANILANPLIELAPTLKSLLSARGVLILSGVLAVDADRVFAAYENDFIRVDMQQKDEWVLMVLENHARSKREETNPAR